MEQLKDLLQGKLDNIQSKMEEGQNIAFVSKELRNGFTQVPNRILDNPKISLQAKTVYTKLLSYAWSEKSVSPDKKQWQMI